MKSCKRIEIIIEEPMVPKMTELLRQLDVSGFTSIANAGGEGDRGIRRADELAGDSSNTLFIIACEEDALVDQIVEGVRPLIKRSGGMCLVSDAFWLIH